MLALTRRRTARRPCVGRPLPDAVRGFGNGNPQVPARKVRRVGQTGYPPPTAGSIGPSTNALLTPVIRDFVVADTAQAPSSQGPKLVDRAAGEVSKTILLEPMRALKPPPHTALITRSACDNDRSGRRRRPRGPGRTMACAAPAPARGPLRHPCGAPRRHPPHRGRPGCH